MQAREQALLCNSWSVKLVRRHYTKSLRLTSGSLPRDSPPMTEFVGIDTHAQRPRPLEEAPASSEKEALFIASSKWICGLPDTVTV